ncbi:MAG TPA: phage tail protein, partial [Candidatus Elarobacter sp.]|nr:phage tail protein [Candidatus Elarobacter sp.]
IFDLATASDDVVPAGETYVLRDENLGPFAHVFGSPPQYADAREDPPALLPLLPLSLNSFTTAGSTDPASPAVFDSGAAATVWHRVFLEAILPPKCGCVIWLAAADRASDLLADATRWYPHVAGDADTSTIPRDVLPDVPRAVWQSMLPEVPFAPALLNADPVPNRTGLFMALVQRVGKTVRSLRGRYLGVRVALNGDGRNTPEIAALRAYASRFSYVEHYLPAIYREDAFGAAAEYDGTSTRRDFFERFVDGFEAQLTRIEDRVANAYLLTRPEATPDGALDWLGGWVGIEPSGYPPARRRARLEATPDLYRERGTANGVTLALDVATDGMCARGAVVVIEDFRLRHIFATILGADLSDRDDPLLPGYTASDNAFVGDTLFLGDPHVQAELQALYQTDLELAGEAAATAAFYDQLAHRMTVFVHDQVEPVDAQLVQRVVEREKPAHVAATMQRASAALMVGLASLVGVDTYLAPEPPPATATVGVSDVGRWDVVRNLATLDPRLEGAAPQSDVPVVRIAGPASTMPGDAIALGATATLQPGRRAVSYTWSLLPPSSPP